MNICSEEVEATIVVPNDIAGAKKKLSATEAEAKIKSDYQPGYMVRTVGSNMHHGGQYFELFTIVIVDSRAVLTVKLVVLRRL